MAQQIAAARQNTEQRMKPRGHPWPPGVSGNPAGARVKDKRATELFDAMLAEFGDLDAVDRVMLEQACRLMAKSERVKDPDSAVRLSNASARLLMNLRKTRGKREPPGGPTLAEYLAQRGRIDEDELEPQSVTPVVDGFHDAIPAPPVRKRSAVRTRSAAGREEPTS